MAKHTWQKCIENTNLIWRRVNHILKIWSSIWEKQTVRVENFKRLSRIFSDGQVACEMNIVFKIKNLIGFDSNICHSFSPEQKTAKKALQKHLSRNHAKKCYRIYINFSIIQNIGYRNITMLCCWCYLKHLLVLTAVTIIAEWFWKKLESNYLEIPIV